MSRRIECEGSMHDWGDVASNALVAILAGIFRIAEEGASRFHFGKGTNGEQGLSNEASAHRS
jgi:hypothetical protein